MGKTKVVSLSEAKAARDKKRYASTALKAWDDLDHADKRKMLDRKAEIQIKNREKL